MNKNLERLMQAVNQTDEIHTGLYKENVLSNGGEGVVVKCREAGSEIRHAVKLIPLDAGDRRRRESIENQVQIWQEFEKVNDCVVSLRGAGMTEICGVGAYFFITRFHPKGSLGDLIKGLNYEDITARAFFEICQQIFKGFFASARRIQQTNLEPSKTYYHGDIKPDNVLLARDDDHYVAKVTDFGIASASSGPITGLSIPYLSLIHI